MKWLTLALLALSAIASGEARAQSVQNRVHYTTSGGDTRLLAGVALNVSSGSRTVTLTVGGRNRITWQIDLTRSAATTLTMACKGSLNGGKTYADITDQTISAGTGTIVAHMWQRDVSGGSANTIVEMSAAAYDNVQCVFGGASAGGSDLVTVYAVGGAGL